MKTIYAIKNAGFKDVFIQWYNKDWEFTQEKQLQLCKNLKLNIVFAHLGYDKLNYLWLEGDLGDKLVKEYLHDLDIMKENNINLVVMHTASPSSSPQLSPIGIARFQQIADYALELDIKIAFENTSNYTAFDFVLKNISNKNVGVCLDSGHLHCFFKDKINWKLLKNRIFALHLHDNYGQSDQHNLPFDGTIRWQKLMKKIKKLGYTGPISLESCYRREYLDLNIDEFYSKSYDRAKMLEEL